jgi:phage pi2 protein 07
MQNQNEDLQNLSNLSDLDENEDDSWNLHPELKNPRYFQSYDILKAVRSCPNLYRLLKENGTLEDFVNDLAEKWWNIVRQMLKNGAPRWLAENTAWELIAEEIAAEEAIIASKGEEGLEELEGELEQ